MLERARVDVFPTGQPIVSVPWRTLIRPKQFRRSQLCLVTSKRDFRRMSLHTLRLDDRYNDCNRGELSFDASKCQNVLIEHPREQSCVQKFLTNLLRASWSHLPDFVHACRALHLQMTEAFSIGSPVQDYPYMADRDYRFQEIEGKVRKQLRRGEIVSIYHSIAEMKRDFPNISGLCLIKRAPGPSEYDPAHDPQRYLTTISRAFELYSRVYQIKFEDDRGRWRRELVTQSYMYAMHTGHGGIDSRSRKLDLVNTIYGLERPYRVLERGSVSITTARPTQRIVRKHYYIAQDMTSGGMCRIDEYLLLEKIVSSPSRYCTCPNHDHTGMLQYHRSSKPLMDLGSLLESAGKTRTEGTGILGGLLLCISKHCETNQFDVTVKETVSRVIPFCLSIELLLIDTKTGQLFQQPGGAFHGHLLPSSAMREFPGAWKHSPSENIALLGVPINIRLVDAITDATIPKYNKNGMPTFEVFDGLQQLTQDMCIYTGKSPKIKIQICQAVLCKGENSRRVKVKFSVSETWRFYQQLLQEQPSGTIQVYSKHITIHRVVQENEGVPTDAKCEKIASASHESPRPPTTLSAQLSFAQTNPHEKNVRFLVKCEEKISELKDKLATERKETERLLDGTRIMQQLYAEVSVGCSLESFQKTWEKYVSLYPTALEDIKAMKKIASFSKKQGRQMVTKLSKKDIEELCERGHKRLLEASKVVEQRSVKEESIKACPPPRTPPGPRKGTKFRPYPTDTENGIRCLMCEDTKDDDKFYRKRRICIDCTNETARKRYHELKRQERETALNETVPMSGAERTFEPVVQKRRKVDSPPDRKTIDEKKSILLKTCNEEEPDAIEEVAGFVIESSSTAGFLE